MHGPEPSSLTQPFGSEGCVSAPVVASRLKITTDSLNDEAT